MTGAEALTNTFCLLDFVNPVRYIVESFSQLPFSEQQLNLKDVSLEDDAGVCAFANRFYLSEILLCCPELVPALESVMVESREAVTTLPVESPPQLYHSYKGKECLIET